MLLLAQHIIAAKAQQLNVNEAVRLAKEAKEMNLPFNHSRYILTFDYAQNLSLLHFEEE